MHPPPSRRAALAAGAAALAAVPPPAAARPRPSQPPPPRPAQQEGVEATGASVCASSTTERPPFTGPGPYAVARLPPLEHVCASLAPACSGKQCAVTLELVVPRSEGVTGGGGPRAPCHGPRPAPLAVLTGGFLVGRDAYAVTAERLASWGFAVVTYDKAETALDPLDDVVSADMILEILDFCAAARPLRPLCDASRPYLCGHSRGGKLSVLAAARDAAAGVARVAALGLVDPVNNTTYAPQSPRFPSATAALRAGGVLARGPPLLAVGAGRAADCAPREANYKTFFDAAPGAAWEVNVTDAGHFQFLDAQTGLQRAVCTAGKTDDGAVRDAAAGALVAWGLAALYGGHGDRGVTELLDAAEADVAAVLGGGEDAVAARRKRVVGSGALAAWAD